MKNKVEDLRNHLFEALEAIKDADNPMDLDRAKAICDVAGRIIDTAKAETDFLRVVGATKGSGFIPTAPRLPERPKHPLEEQGKVAALTIGRAKGIGTA